MKLAAKEKYKFLNKENMEIITVNKKSVHALENTPINTKARYVHKQYAEQGYST